MAIAVRLIWWGSVAWLGLAAIAIVILVIGWIGDTDNPLRHERALAAGLVLVYSAVPALGAIVAAFVPETGLSRRKRIFSVALVATMLATVVIFDYVQAKYRDDAQPRVQPAPPIGAVLSRRAWVAAGRLTRALAVIGDRG